jgi:hypothetical protein
VLQSGNLELYSHFKNFVDADNLELKPTYFGSVEILLKFLIDFPAVSRNNLCNQLIRSGQWKLVPIVLKMLPSALNYDLSFKPKWDSENLIPNNIFLMIHQRISITFPLYCFQIPALQNIIKYGSLRELKALYMQQKAFFIDFSIHYTTHFEFAAIYGRIAHLKFIFPLVQKQLSFFISPLLVRLLSRQRFFTAGVILRMALKVPRWNPDELVLEGLEDPGVLAWLAKKGIKTKKRD